VFRALAAGHGLEDFRLFTGTGVLGKMPDVDDAISAGVGALAVVEVEIVISGGWVRWMRYSHGVNLLSRLAGSRGVSGSCGTIFTSKDLRVLNHRSCADSIPWLQ
jgi:hypothetical protein